MEHPLQFELLDGGFLYELNKYESNYGYKLIKEKPQLVQKIHQDYIDIGCKYITSGNYPFKPSRMNDWKIASEEIISLLYALKQESNFVLLGSIPPFYESYQPGEVTGEFINYYFDLKQIMTKKIDKYLIETMVNCDQLKKICQILDDKPLFISLYPKNDIGTKDLEYLLDQYNVEAIMINCCSFEDMYEYYQRVISKIEQTYKYKFGFYLNKIDEYKYKHDRESKVEGPLDTYAVETSDNPKIGKFVRKLNEIYGDNVIVGGCCGYGLEETKNLVTSISHLKCMKR